MAEPYQVPDDLLLIGIVEAENDGRTRLADFDGDNVRWLEDALAAVLPRHEYLVRKQVLAEHIRRSQGPPTGRDEYEELSARYGQEIAKLRADERSRVAAEYRAAVQAITDSRGDNDDRLAGAIADGCRTDGMSGLTFDDPRSIAIVAYRALARRLEGDT